MKLLILAGILVVLVIIGAVLWYWFNQPLYRPGDIRAGKDMREPLAPPEQAGATPGFWRVARDIELFHFEQGTGADVLVVDGGPGFPRQTPWLANDLLAAKYRLVYYHQRGCGESTRPVRSLPKQNTYKSMQELNKTLGLPAQVADIERIRRILGREKLVLAGHSFGAFLAALYAAEFPEHVRAIVAIAPANVAMLPNPEGDIFALIERRLPAERRPEFRSFYSQYFDFTGNLKRSDDELAALHREFGRFWILASGAGAPPAAGAPIERNGGFMPLAVYLSMGRRHDYREAFRAVRVPVLVIHGANDLQPRTWSQAFAELFPMHKFVEIAGAGHMVFDDQPAQFTSAVQAFLGTL